MDKLTKRKDKKDYEKVKQEWIEMQDLNQPKNQALNTKFVKEEGSQYQEEKIKREAYETETRLKQQEILKQKYNLSLQNKKNNIQINQVKKQPRKKPTLPMVEVTCDFCTVPQSVPGNTQLYICGSCQNISECYPLYGIVICGCCQCKVGFGFGMSEYIKCPKCASINKVPLQAPKNYQSMSPVSLKQNVQPSKQNQYRQKQREEDFFYAGFQKKQSQDLI